MEDARVRRMKILLLTSSLVCLALLLLAAYEENFTAEWRGYQREYASRLRELAAATGKPAIDYPIEVRQIYLEGLGRVDRCVNCHVAIDNPAFQNEPQPLTAHPGDTLKHHPADKFGCTICHLGQGRATILPDAHGRVPHWPEPMLEGKLVYTSCGRCHYENDLYGGQTDLYGQVTPIKEIREAELRTVLPGADNIARGKRLVVEHGCLGCHKYRGRGGTIGPDITYVGDKTVHQFDFRHVEGEHTVENWLVSHFKSPSAVVPGTLMPDMGLTDQEAHDLAAYMMSLKRKSAPAAYTPLPQPLDPTPVSGETLYKMYCSACHGPDGVGAVVRVSKMFQGIDRPRELLTPSLRNEDTLAVASDDYLRAIIRTGRRGTSMLSWLHEGGLTPDEIDRVVAYIRSWQRTPPPLASISSKRGNPEYGRALYRSRCRNCHGSDGRGGIGVALRSTSLLSVATDEFLARTIVHGRAGTAMPSWKHLTADEVSDLLAFLRTWEHKPPSKKTVLEKLAKGKPSRRSLRIGQVLYRSNCATCHGQKGQGALGPSLNTDAFLAIVDDEYLYTAIVEGHPGTAMPFWKHLEEDDLVDLINYLRSFNKRNRRELKPFLARGDWDRGRIIFEGACAGCHGQHAEGGTGPQLRNPVFLASATDAMLREWIANGRPNTEMRPCRKGGFGVVELTDSQIEDVISYLRRLQDTSHEVTFRPAKGIVPHGAQIYAAACASCHGKHGEGMTGSALSNPDFLKSASDGFLLATIILGRDGTKMQPMGKGAQGNIDLSADDISNVVAFIRHWEQQPPIQGVAHRYVMAADLQEGEQLFAGHCAGCHGPKGKDGWAPALNNADFLAAASDGFLQATIARGRSGTAMRAFGKGCGGVTELTSEQINNIVAYIRTWAPPEYRPSTPPTPADSSAEPAVTRNDERE
ncbi:MAG: c-type cytochrome [Planctomycetes bacterium]|nr:c-type cytochrome [Planctomycetota bacterium]